MIKKAQALISLRIFFKQKFRMICQFRLDNTPVRMFHARNYNRCRRVQHQWSQIRTQTNAATVAAPAMDDSAPAIHKSAEWLQARPFEEMPLEGGFTFIRKLMPGGKYYKKEMPQIMLDLHKQHGGIYRLPSIMGKPGMVVTYDPQDYERVFRNEGIWPGRPGNYALHYHRSVLKADFYQGVEGILSSQGEKWGSFRSSVNPVMMQPKTIRLYYQKMSQVNKEFVKRIYETRDAQTLEVPDNFEEEIHRWTLESVSVVALDKQFGLLGANRNDPMAKKLFSAINVFMTTAAEIEFKPSIWRYVQTPTFKKLIRSLDEMQEVCSLFVNEAIGRLESENTKKPDHEQSVLEKLLKIDKRVATVMAMDMLMAGVDTTSSTFVSIMLCLAKNPEKQAKLREEIMQILPNKDSEFTESSMKNLPYLRACIKESMRHYPLVLGNARILNQDVVLNGYRVPKGTHVGMMAHMLEYDKGYFPRAAEFLPERWLRSSNNSAEQSKCPATNDLKPTNPFVYLPFGFGPRMCIGKRIVEMELELGVARIIRNFHVEFNYPTDKVFRSVLINVPNVPLKFKFSDVEN